jgi:hypothetical protein
VTHWCSSERISSIASVREDGLSVCGEIIFYIAVSDPNGVLPVLPATRATGPIGHDVGQADSRTMEPLRSTSSSNISSRRRARKRLRPFPPKAPGSLVKKGNFLNQSSNPLTMYLYQHFSFLSLSLRAPLNDSLSADECAR